MSTSPAQLTANRRNALRSTGPRTPAGKAISRQNALRHGITSADITLSAPHVGEDPADFDCLLAHLLDTYDPVGLEETLLVNDLATLLWRRRRLLRTETAVSSQSILRELERRQDAAREQLDRVTGSVKIAAMVSSREPWNHDVVAARDRLMSLTLGLAWARDRILEAIESIEQHRGLTARARCRLAIILPHDHPAVALLPPTPFHPMDFEDTDEHACRVDDPAAAIVALTAFADGLARQHDEAIVREQADEISICWSQAFPPAPLADTLLRYEKQITTQLTRTANELRRLQHARRLAQPPGPLPNPVSDPVGAAPSGGPPVPPSSHDPNNHATFPPTERSSAPPHPEHPPRTPSTKRTQFPAADPPSSSSLPTLDHAEASVDRPKITRTRPRKRPRRAR